MAWHVLYTKSRNEKKVADLLGKSGLEAYCPVIEQVKQWSDRKKKVTVPLISSYVFVNIEEKDRDKVFLVPGVVRYLFWLGRPAIVRDEEIIALKKGLKGSLSSVEVSDFNVGDVVPIPEGPFRDKEGTVKTVTNNKLQLVLKELGVLITLTKETKL
ncbi:UpxY family transcription antiterminator [Sediminibacter sp. Hel_I_10]|uniref:UpxY family transcription antiterminator n=1 Tax=Sediminibacter sp. Hel_I_10 TaxID=1392490 RepID=UPI00047B904D|nr:UpxY family transcription antiterminator [Sediminibacter sp. Hel_I_10]